MTRLRYGAAIDAGEAGSGTDADAFTERGNDVNLLFAGKYVHEGAILVRIGPGGL